MAASLKDIATLLSRGEQPPTADVKVLSAKANAEVDKAMAEILGQKLLKKPL